MSCLKGHRQRHRDGFNESGLGAFEDHEVLKLRLKYAVQRMAVKPIAQTRTLVSVFDALGVPVVNHLIVAGPGTFSLADAGLMRVTAGATT